MLSFFYNGKDFSDCKFPRGGPGLRPSRALLEYQPISQQSGANDGSEDSPLRDQMNSVDQRCGGHRNLMGVDEDDEIFPDDLADDLDFVRAVQKMF
jgi:hypothetical protein